MNAVTELLPLLAAWTLALLSPGPDFVVTVRYSTARSRRDGALVGLGVCSAIAIWAGTSMFGLVAVLSQISWLYDTVRLAGALYLVYLGVQSLLSARKRQEVPAAPVEEVAERSAWRIWRVGFLTNIGNPKAAIFFGSLFSALLPAHTSVWLEVTALALMLTLAIGWFSSVAFLFSLSPVTRAYRKVKRGVDAVTGFIFIALAGRLATE
jgi:RhtB (resistance to homoserine/threonine) family protein